MADQAKVRPLTAGDLDAIVALDQKITGHSRRGFYEKRMKAMASDASSFIALGAEIGGQMKGFLMGYILDGEFGGNAPVAVMDALGVDPRSRGAGLAKTLVASLDAVLKSKGVMELQTQAAIAEQDLISFFIASGFQLAPRLTLERSVSLPADF
ncbi:MAG: GNAT family N-acetyltransferase [Alphaproteobacteria bacterium]|nr:GNAT family N-acetyltransferase [Alphaproteobacteria bacterium]